MATKTMSNQFLKIISAVKRKFVEPKVYAMVFTNGRGAQMLVCEVGYSLEEAFSKARERAVLEAPQLFEDANKITLNLFVAVGFDELLKNYTVTDIEVPQQNDKNELMAKIIDLKSEKMLEEHKGKFSNLEYQFLEEKIKEK